jgi:hypothetical protein
MTYIPRFTLRTAFFGLTVVALALAWMGWFGYSPRVWLPGPLGIAGCVSIGFAATRRAREASNLECAWRLTLGWQLVCADAVMNFVNGFVYMSVWRGPRIEEIVRESIVPAIGACVLVTVLAGYAAGPRVVFAALIRNRALAVAAGLALTSAIVAVGWCVLLYSIKVRDVEAMIISVIQSRQVQRYFQESTRTLAQPTLNVRQLEQTPIPNIPIEQQRLIVDRLTVKRSKFLALEAAQDSMTVELAALLSAILDSAFVGKLKS